MWSDKVSGPGVRPLALGMFVWLAGRRDGRFAYTTMATLPLA